jgi:hypothetical protein
LQALAVQGCKHCDTLRRRARRTQELTAADDDAVAALAALDTSADVVGAWTGVPATASVHMQTIAAAGAHLAACCRGQGSTPGARQGRQRSPSPPSVQCKQQRSGKGSTTTQQQWAVGAREAKGRPAMVCPPGQQLQPQPTSGGGSVPRASASTPAAAQAGGGAARASNSAPTMPPTNANYLSSGPQRHVRHVMDAGTSQGSCN